MRALPAALLAASLPAATVAFVPVPRVAAAAVGVGLRATTPAPDVDVEHATHCTEHLGECSLEDMGRMRDGERRGRSRENRIVVPRVACRLPLTRCPLP